MDSSSPGRSTVLPNNTSSSTTSIRSLHILAFKFDPVLYTLRHNSLHTSQTGLSAHTHPKKHYKHSRFSFLLASLCPVQPTLDSDCGCGFGSDPSFALGSPILQLYLVLAVDLVLVLAFGAGHCTSSCSHGANQ